MKKILASMAAFAAMTVGAFAAGTIPLSLSQQFDSQGKPLSGGMLYLIQAGTTATPQNAYQDSGLTIPLPNPIVLDAAGRVPQLFIADGQIKVRLTDKNGIVQLTADNILVIGPSSGGGGGGGQVDPTTIAQTGDVKYRYDDASVAGWVRSNGRTIGSASSGATERANADCQALFEYLWGKDSTLVVSGGRGASAAADWAANKTIALPDARGRTMASLAGMGASDSGIFNGVTFTKGDATTLGSLLGASRRQLLEAHLPYLVKPLAITSTASSLTNAQRMTATAIVSQASGTVHVPLGSGMANATVSTSVTSTGTVTFGGDQYFDAVSPFLLVTTYIKL